MNRMQEFLKELNQESVTTQKMLSIVPNDKFDWKPHPKSMNLRQLTGHIAELPSWIKMVMNTKELDFSQNPYTAPVFNNTKELLGLFEKHLHEGREDLTADKENLLDETWTLRNAEEIYLAAPKASMIRHTLSQIIHHRAQLGVFLRLLDIPIPGSYGPSADEQEMN